MAFNSKPVLPIIQGGFGDQTIILQAIVQNILKKKSSVL